ncbi:Meiotic expression up-regulated protein [Lachnellula hyalina]|uniref:Meiotic expression up-regulated protein n=1 Tax=Lachnellula hyalina TaxID=1316788 RepID=A0A8H8TV03_9HELO|nr:Meiotic expression up-regulated protein [Lachnellula hyalina]TVY22827.1 Meiotic expression up-regulated protein [Lachnellula hyalina]
MDSSDQAQFNQPQIQAPSYTFNPNNKFRRDFSPRPFSSVTMNPPELSVKTEPLGLGMWSSPTPPVSRPRPATIHESVFPYSFSEEFNSLPAWDSSTMPMQPVNDGLPQTYSVQQDFYPSTSGGENGWQSKACNDGIDLQNLDTDMHMGQQFSTDESAPILDLRFSGPGMDSDRLSLEPSYSSRRMSGSSFTVSTTGALSEMQSYDDFSTTLSEAQSYTSDYPPRSNRNSLMSSTQLSPVASPRMTPQHRSELVRTQSRGRASPSPRPSMRSAPYNMDSSRNKRWSTGSYAPAQNRRPSPFIYHQGHEVFTPHPPRMSSRHSSPILPNAQLPLNLSNLQTQQHPFLIQNNTGFHRNSMLLPSGNYQETHQFEAPPPLLSHGLFRMLQSNADPHSLHSHYTDLSDPPDLYASLHEEQVPPPPEDMNPSDGDLVPHEQELRFDGDLYTPRWVRGHGNKREGWCGICKPGRWLVLKNSAFWYDKSFTHGISAATGSPFQEPQETRRMDGNPDVWEGLCGSCNEWVALVSSKKKGTTWFRHAYKCHTHPKIKDAPKRRRESSHTRALGASTMAKPKNEPPMTPQMTPSNSVANTPVTPGMLHQSQARQNRKTTINPLEGLSGMI